MTSTTSGTETSLRSLRDRPFELLKEIEKRSRAVTVGNAPQTSAGREWVGVAFRMGGETFLVAREETREIMAMPAALMVATEGTLEVQVTEVVMFWVVEFFALPNVPIAVNCAV